MQEDEYGINSFELFLNGLQNMNIVNEATARNLRDSSMRLLTVINDDEKSDMRTLSIDGLVRRYMAQSEAPPSEASMQAYKSRMQSAIDKFIAYQDASLDLIGKVEDNSSNKKGKTRMTQQRKAVKKDEGEVKVFDLPIPLRSDLILKVENLPRDLTIDEAERIANIIKSFAIPS
ncbi:hypothetical protein B7R74_02665 [Yersinia pseudotuberculosis]|uniref:hypothetical protein n=1 Tax=Yersinia pseudotuberculosis TaxID=633 RepID=UPI0005DF2F73|nr:hypothetical protein [Yersinia pseudotuberculosis]AYX13999.1 hypothetical protein EGX44_01705 [Yersinia pseudotuberculosis]PSH17664.1 hypothetical protein BLA52_13200 [Yersinia pseudotuberculosis]PSH23556.1 hypothetical protein B7R74_02665 [Yersinia pseudotuberculosis]PSH27841.1 hypothetical protein BLA50_03375 [Yersinia pseudotuberculosis]PSH33462.1 hypothetical protein BA197_15565 [Yersinia pseudotuberculosis]